MSFLRLNLNQSLIGRAFIGNDERFPLLPSDWNKYILAEQVVPVQVVGLKPNTVYRAFLNDVDVTSLCKIRGGRLGDGLRTAIFNPVLTFDFYFIARESATTQVERAAADAILVGGVRTLVIRSIDGSATATAQLAIPQYARQGGEVIIKKTPPTDTNQVAQNITYVEVPGAADKSYYYTPSNYSFIQTFYADGEVVANARDVYLTSVDLFLRSKPSTTANVSGNPSAGVAIAICEVENDQPVLSKTYSKSLSYKAYADVYAFGDASTPTTFSFDQPLKLATNKFYGIVIIFEDPAYELWTNKVGARLINTNIPSPGVNSNKDGKLFARNSTGIFNSLSDTDAKFSIRCAKFTSEDETKTFVNRDYEFFTVDNQVGNFLPGEYVWQDRVPQAGTVSTTRGSNIIRGSGTAFNNLNVDDFIVLTSGNISQVVSVADINSATEVVLTEPANFTTNNGTYIVTVVGKMFYQNRVRRQLYLSDSSAINAAGRLFTVGALIRGSDSAATANISTIDALSIDRVRLRGDVAVPIEGTLEATITPTRREGNSFVFDDANAERIAINNQRVYNVTKQDAQILSRSLELVQASLFSDPDSLVDKKSLRGTVRFTRKTNGFTSPEVEGSSLDLFLIENVISDECDINVDGILVDTEVGNNGIALAKHVGVKVPFANERFAEDVRMFMIAYRPQGTEIRAYVRLHNSKDPEAFDDKSWTPLEYVTNGNRYSSAENQNDFVEFELGLPQFGESAIVLPGTFTASVGSEVITAANGTVSNITDTLNVGDVVRIYNPLFPNTNYQVGVVAARNGTTITLADPIETINLSGSGNRVEKIKYPYAAFNNINNSNIARYYNTSLAEFDTFDSMQVKIVMLSNTTYIVPRIDQIQVLGVSA